MRCARAFGNDKGFWWRAYSFAQAASLITARSFRLTHLSTGRLDLKIVNGSLPLRLNLNGATVKIDYACI